MKDLRDLKDLTMHVGDRYPTMVKTLHEVKTGSKFRSRAHSKDYDYLHLSQ